MVARLPAASLPVPAWISDPTDLGARLARARPDRVGLDTEFIRERTYWPKLALVQIAFREADGSDAIVLADPLAPGMQDALATLLVDESVLKVMHSPSEDLVALGRDCGALPAPLFDTQAAAALAGVGAGMGYQRLVEQVTGTALRKGETRSDWLRRPLSPAQLEYAADDVRHLFALHDELERRLRELDRLAWLAEDSVRILEAAADDAGEPWPHLAMRTAQYLDADAQRRLLRLLRWRDAHARASDRPRSWILDNELATALARKPPADRGSLQAQLEATPKAPRALGDALWQALATPLADEDAMPLARDTDADKATMRRLQEAVATRSADLGLPDGVLASRRLLQALLDRRAAGDQAWPDALQGWRRAALEPVLAPLLAPGLAPDPGHG
jgi:ribonuclease D